ncbi:uncharacterized protein LOC122573373 isoform X2 [Bombus pyrosoma]|uniref:uncharacterized protein LOC122573373 isoform X2 n=1 Tax=Bombus pyrosoma TaxID=396416 RepID=UPI001CB9AFE2|nr:uncharacterized protein LOC122573373 isoform X2 [Bombus pyrosoma]
MNDAAQKGVKAQKSATAGATGLDESHGSTNRSSTQQDVIKDSRSIVLRTTSSSDGDKGAAKKKDGVNESAELTQRLSRTETVRQDARKLKTATLNRMGKMFKQRSQTPVADKSCLDIDSDINPAKTMESEDAAKKEKSNSLGRMLKLVDKDGSPKKMFHPRAGSLSRMLRRNPNNEDNDDKKHIEENAPGIFSRMLNQLRGRPQSGNATLEPNLKTRDKISSLPPKVPLNSRTVNLSSSTSTSSPQTRVTESPQKLSNFEYSI